jgi:NADH-quinone oxidoreductase subunit L
LNLDPWLWLIPAAPLIGFLLNGSLVGPRLQRMALGLPAGGTPAPAAHGHHEDHTEAHPGAAPVHHDDPKADHDAGHGHAHGPVNTGPLAIIGAIAVAGPLLAFVISVLAVMGIHEGVGPHAVYWSWLQTGGLDLGFGFSIDALTGVMLLFVTGIGTLIHLYSYGYMNHDPGFYRFMAYLNLFMFSMLCLVLGDNLVVLFLGWEGVGLCSYLLVGFWFEELANVDAGRKAFLFNRVGDFAFLLGMFTLYSLVGSLSFGHLEAVIGPADVGALVRGGVFGGWHVGSVLTLAALLLFVGATGKSAQIPLYVWLPDAMAGPTPVSALIHAATMVTAGVYMVGRLDFLYAHTPLVTTTIGVVAALTALLSALIALAQNDIKKVLAYSTISQLGYMFAGMATTFWGAGLFHVVTHAFFKALLFLGAGAVIHALENEQDIRKMGGLWKDMRLESILFLVGAAALAGVPGLAGFWSKDEILGNTLLLATRQGGAWWTIYLVLTFTAFLTAFYTTRLVVIAFFGAPADPHRHPHKTHWTMMVPLVLLALGAVFSGLALGSPFSHALETFTEPVWSVPSWHGSLDEAKVASIHLEGMGISVAMVVLGVGLAGWLYGYRRDLVDRFATGPGKGLYDLATAKFEVDELYGMLVIEPTKRLARALFTGVDRGLIDGALVNGSARVVDGVGVALRRVHTGAINAATASMTIGAVAILIYLGWLVSHG